MPDRPPKVTFTPEEQAIIDRHRHTPIENGLPVVPHPGIFQKEPVTQGPPALNAAMLAIQKAFPWLTDQMYTKLVTQGITRDAADVMREDAGRSGETFPGSNTFGLRNRQTGDITLNPDPGGPREGPRTLVHELLHGTGHMDNDWFTESEGTNFISKQLSQTDRHRDINLPAPRHVTPTDPDELKRSIIIQFLRGESNTLDPYWARKP